MTRAPFSGANIGAFNLGTGFGAWLGGLTIAAGLGYTSSIWSGAPVVGLGLLALIYARVLDRRPRTSLSRSVTVTGFGGTTPTPASDASVVVTTLPARTGPQSAMSLWGPGHVCGEADRGGSGWAQRETAALHIGGALVPSVEVNIVPCARGALVTFGCGRRCPLVRDGRGVALCVQ